MKTITLARLREFIERSMWTCSHCFAENYDDYWQCSECYWYR